MLFPSLPPSTTHELPISAPVSDGVLRPRLVRCRGDHCASLCALQESNMVSVSHAKCRRCIYRCIAAQVSPTCKGIGSLPGVAITHHGTCICICRLAELVAANAPSGSSGSNSRRRHSEFAIDAAHELARFIFDNLTPAMPNDDEAGNSSRHKTVEDAPNMLQGKIILKSAAYICPSANLSPASTSSSSGMHELQPNQRLKKEKCVSCLLYAKSEASTGSSEHCVS